MAEPQSISVNEDAQLIPVWSIVASVASFLAVEYYFWFVLADKAHTTPLGFRLYFNTSWGVLAALYFLMVGYVSRDAPRRAMSPRFWMLLCFVMPGGIGAVLYFLLRSPLIARCPACSSHVESEFHFCPQCNFPLTASCGNCHRTVRPTDRYCTRCGHELAQDPLPSRLRALG
jgi:hypothetical protein